MGSGNTRPGCPVIAPPASPAARLAPLIQGWRMRRPWGRKDALPSPALPLRPLGWLLLQLGWLDTVSQACPIAQLALPEPKQAWGRPTGGGGAAGLCIVGKPTSQQVHRAGYTKPRKGTRTEQAWMRPPKLLSSLSSMCQLVPPTFWPCLFSSSWLKRNSGQGVSQGHLLP